MRFWGELGIGCLNEEVAALARERKRYSTQWCVEGLPSPVIFLNPKP